MALASLLLSGCATNTTRLQEKALRLHALGGCEILDHEDGDACSSEVEGRFPGCVKPFLAHETEIEDFYECLGFLLPDPPAPSIEVGRCEKPHIIAEISVSLAKRTAWDGSSAREIRGKTWFVANSPVVSTPDILELRLEEQGENSYVHVKVTEEASRRFGAITRANVGESMMIVVNDYVVSAQITSGVSGSEYSLLAPAARVEDLCNSP